MDSRFKRNNFKPRPSFNKFQTNFSLPPDKVPDEELVKQLFVVVANGNFFEINKFVMENNMTLTGVDDDNNSILHHVMYNTNITNAEKISLMTALIEKGASVSIFNKNNVTPLHLAAKQQIPEIIKLLIEKGADPNAPDSQDMTPLHYCVKPTTVKCIDLQGEKDKLIPDDIVDIDDNDNYTKQIISEINTFIDGNEEVKAMIEHCKRILLDIDVNNTPDVNNNITEIKNSITKKVAEGVDVEDRIVLEIIREGIQSVRNKMNSKLKTTTSNISSKQSVWAVDDLGKVKLLPYLGLSNMMAEITNSIQKTINNSVSDINKKVGALDKDMSKVATELSEIVAPFNNMLISLYTANASGDDVTVAVDPNTLANNTINEILLGGHYALTYVNLFTAAIYREHGNNLDSADLRIPNTDILLTDQFVDFRVLDPIFDSVSTDTRRGTIEPTRSTNVKKNGKQLKLELTSTPEHRSTYTVFGVFRVLMDRINYIITEITQGLANTLPGSVTDMNKDPSESFEGLLNTHYFMLSLCIHLTMMRRFVKSDLKTGLRNLAEYMMYFDDAALNATPIYGSTMQETISTHGEALAENIEKVDKLAQYIESIYSKVHGIVNQLDNIIDATNMYYGYKYIRKYYSNNMDDFDAATANTVDSRYDNMMCSRIPYFSKVPPNLDEFVVSDEFSLDELKNNTLAKFGQQQRSGDIPIMTLRGFGSGNVDPAPGHFTIPRMNLDNRVEFSGVSTTFPIDTTVYPGPFGTNVTYTDSNPNKVARLASIQSIDRVGTRKSSQDIVFPIVSSVLDHQLNMNKYAIIRIVLKSFYDSLVSPADSTIKTTLKEFHDSINNQLGINTDDYTIVMTVVANALNKMFTRLVSDGVGIVSKSLMTYILSDSRIDLDSQVAKLSLVTNYSSYDKLFEDIKDEVNKIGARLIEANDDNIPSFNQMLSNFEDYDRPKQHRLSKFLNKEDVCFEINTDALKALIDAGVDANARDIVGNTPLMYAIDLQHEETIDILLGARLSTCSNNSANKEGNTPLTYSAYKLHNHAHTINMDEVISATVKKIEKEITSESAYPRILNRSKLILPMVLYLVNHQLTLMEIRHYSPDTGRKWLFEDHTTLYSELNITDSGFPLVHSNTPDKVKTNVNPGVTRLIMKTNNRLAEKQAEHTSLTNSKTNITREKTSLGALDTAIKQYKHRQLEKYEDTIDIQIGMLDGEIAALVADLDRLRAKETTGAADKVLNDLKVDLSTMDYDYNRSHITRIYDKMFHKINEGRLAGINSIKADLTSYYRLWECLLENGLPLDSTQLPILCIKELSTKSNNIRLLTVMGQFWNNVLDRQISDYFELPRIYDRHNYVLNSLIRIYAHVIRHTLCINYYTVLFKLLINYVATKHTDYTSRDGERDNKIEDIMKSIMIDSTSQTNPLLDYVLNVMPLRLVKNILHVHKHGNDPTRSTNPREILEEALHIIMNNKGMTILPTDKMIINIKDYIIPHFMKYFEIYIVGCDSMVDGYLKGLRELSSDVKIFTKILDHSIKEQCAN